MINFRFHIVSLTAVLLALGIGLVLGTTFLDDATINGLKSQLDGLEHDLDNAEARNDAQQERLDAFEEEASQLDEQLGERLYRGQLEAEPVLVIATEGVDESWVDGVMRSLTQADADVLGVWWLTERLTLDEESELSDLSAALELSTSDADRLSRNLAMQLGDVLFGAVDVPAEVGLADPAQTSPAEPAPLARLRDAGFVRYQLPDGVEGDVVRLPVSGLRVVVVAGPDATVPVDDVLVPVLADLAADGPMPVVATQPTVRTGDDVDEAREPRLVSAIRDDDTLRERISTVDNLDTVSGRAATVLAAVDAVPGAPTIGRYGTGDGADRRLPPVDGDG
ncbi:MAG TPA: copper transporter [Acidimicrobiales bacterium]|nr:copper transporter [Acidimicrobiales bacterium]